MTLSEVFFSIILQDTPPACNKASSKFLVWFQVHSLVNGSGYASVEDGKPETYLPTERQ